MQLTFVAANSSPGGNLGSQDIERGAELTERLILLQRDTLGHS